MSEHLGMPAGMGGSTLSSAGTTLTSAGTTLSSAGTTLSSSGTMLTDAAGQLEEAASALSSSVSESATGGGGGGGGGFGSFLSGILNPSGSDASAGIGGALSVDSAGNRSSMGGTAVGGMSTDSLGNFLSMGNTDITAGAGTGGLLASEAESGGGLAAAGSAGSGTIGVGGALGIAGAAIGGGFALAQEWKSGNTGAAILTGAMTGASIGMIAGGPIGAGIGAAIGGIVGFIGSLFSDHGLSKAKQYDAQTLQPALQREIMGYDAGQIGYDQLWQDLGQLSTQAKTATQGFGSAAVQYFNNTMTPEINAIQNQVNKLELGDRPEKVTFSAAQYHDGGSIAGFRRLRHQLHRRLHPRHAGRDGDEPRPPRQLTARCWTR